MTPDEHIAEMERTTIEVMRVAQTTLKIVTDRETNEEAARQLVTLLHSLNRTEAMCLIVILAAQCAAVTDASVKVMVDFVATTTNEAPPGWVIPAMNDAMRAFMQKGLDPDRPGLRQLMHDMFTANIKEEDNG